MLPDAVTKGSSDAAHKGDEIVLAFVAETFAGHRMARIAVPQLQTRVTARSIQAHEIPQRGHRPVVKEAFERPNTGQAGRLVPSGEGLAR